MNKLITLYHGSELIIETPEFGKGRKNNDYGFGFYCTESTDDDGLYIRDLMKGGISDDDPRIPRNISK